MLHGDLRSRETRPGHAWTLAEKLTEAESTASLPRLPFMQNIAASLQSPATSAPEKPCMRASRAMRPMSTSLERGMWRACFCKMATRSSGFGSGT